MLRCRIVVAALRISTVVKTALLERGFLRGGDRAKPMHSLCPL
jgi:hypothetical protein